MTKYQFVGVDFAWSDPRSVSAYLRGYGDGLGENYDRFYERMRRRYPSMPLETLNLTYRLRRQRIDAIMRRIQYAVSHIVAPWLKFASTVSIGVVIGYSLAGK